MKKRGRRLIESKLDAIIRARRELIEAGEIPTTRKVAGVFGVSTTTIHRFLMKKA